ncbi:MAG: hypothetical protein WDN27_04505 [Candidatus Saccharibacteria bacterium]
MNDELVQLIVEKSIASCDAPAVAVRLDEIAAKNGKTFLQELGEGDGKMLKIFEQMVQAEIEAQEGSF